MKIPLSIAGLLSLAVILYAANPTPFTTVNTPIGVAASGTDLIVTEYCGHNVDTIDCQGNVTLLATLPGVSDCREEYVTIAPSQSANAGFTPGDIFVTQGRGVYKVTGGIVTVFAQMPDCGDDHTGITFDHVGTFGYNMIVTCEGGNVWQVDGTGIPTFITGTGTHMEGPAIPPLSFGPFGGQILVADEDSGSVHAIDNTGNVTYDVFSNYGAEGVLVIPSVPCTFCSAGGAYFQAIENFQAGNIYQYPLTDFTGLGGNILVTSEFGAGTVLITYDGTNYNSSFFDNIFGGEFEGGSFADCDVPVPSPTPTPTAAATSTPTPTATATATATATFTPTATATATATATFTPTPTATATSTATATFTPTPTATSTPTPTPTCAAITASETTTPASCFGGTNGSVTVTVSGGTAPYDVTVDGVTHSVATSGGTTTFTALASGTYPASITDAHTCPGSAAGVLVDQPAAITASETTTPASCFGGTNGSVTVTVSGGTAPYDVTVDGVTHSVATSGGTTTFTALASGTYPASITDAHTCPGSAAGVLVDQPAAITASETTTPASCFGGSNGSVTVTVSGGTAPYDVTVDGVTHSVATSGGTTTFTALASGTYPASISDAHTCPGSAAGVLVDQPA